jgi:hypothetical protein
MSTLFFYFFSAASFKFIRPKENKNYHNRQMLSRKKLAAPAKLKCSAGTTSRLFGRPILSLLKRMIPLPKADVNN